MVVSNHSEELGWDNKTLKCFLAGLPSVMPNGFGRKKKQLTVPSLITMMLIKQQCPFQSKQVIPPFLCADTGILIGAAERNGAGWRD